MADEISNAYEQDLYAAKLAAGFERVTGADSGIEWSRRDRKQAEYTITAA